MVPKPGFPHLNFEKLTTPIELAVLIRDSKSGTVGNAGMHSNLGPKTAERYTIDHDVVWAQDCSKQDRLTVTQGTCSGRRAV